LENCFALAEVPKTRAKSLIELAPVAAVKSVHEMRQSTNQSPPPLHRSVPADSKPAAPALLSPDAAGGAVAVACSSSGLSLVKSASALAKVP